MRDTRKVGTNDWASRLQKVTRGQNNSPMEDYLEGQPPADVSTNEELIETLKEKHAKYAAFNRKRVDQRARALEEAGNFRAMEDRGGKFTRGFKPRFGEVKQVKELQDAEVVDLAGKDYLTKFVQPIAESTEDAGPVRIEQRGSELIDSTRRSCLQSFADELIRFVRTKMEKLLPPLQVSI